MFTNRTKVLITVSQDVLDRAREVAGRATTALKLPVSLQIVLRALIEEGLKRPTDRGLLANVEAQARAVRDIRRVARRPPARAEEAVPGPRGPGERRPRGRTTRH
jgi:hypothetical protein